MTKQELAHIARLMYDLQEYCGYRWDESEEYPLPDGTIDNLLEIQKIAIDMSEPDEKGMHYAMMAALIELKERREHDAERLNGREEFMNIVYNELNNDVDNNRANRIIDAADEYAGV